MEFLLKTAILGYDVAGPLLPYDARYGTAHGDKCYMSLKNLLLHQFCLVLP